MRRYALEGVHVLDFSWVGVGPITTKYFADNGADVRLGKGGNGEEKTDGNRQRDERPGSPKEIGPGSAGMGCLSERKKLRRG